MKLSTELKQVIARRLESANSSEILEIASQLCANDEPMEFKFSPPAPQRFIKLDAAGNALPIDSTNWLAVEDTSTGLIWSASYASTEKLKWPDAMKAAAKVELCGLGGWRAPTIQEQLSIVDYGKTSPAIDTTYFRADGSDWCWTSTPLASSPGVYAWYVYFDGGLSYYDDQYNEGLVRAVRPRQ